MKEISFISGAQTEKNDKTNKKIKLKKTHNILTHNLQDDEIKTAVSG
jgi:hypothetical protein